MEYIRTTRGLLKLKQNDGQLNNKLKRSKVRVVQKITIN